MSEQVLHLDFIKLIPETGHDQRNQLEAAAAQLCAIDGIVAIGSIEADANAASDFDIAFWFGLRSFAALEPFGTDPRYSQFLQRSVAPMLQSFAGADVKLDDDIAACDGPAACIALIGPEEAYDFEVREALEAWAASTGSTATATGLAIGERQLYRGAAIAFGLPEPVDKPTGDSFRATLVQGTARTLA